MSKTLKFRRQPIRKHFNVFTACLKVVLNWILLLLKMNTFSFNSTYVSVFSLWLNSLLILIPGSIIRKIVSLLCDLHFLRSPSNQHSMRSTRWHDRRRMGQHYSVSNELDIAEFNLEPNGNWVVRFRARIIIIRQDWKLKRVADIIEEVTLSLCNLVQLV